MKFYADFSKEISCFFHVLYMEETWNLMRTSVRKFHVSSTYPTSQFFFRKKQSMLVTSLERWNYVAFQLAHTLLFESSVNNVARKKIFIRGRNMKSYADFSKEISCFFHVSNKSIFSSKKAKYVRHKFGKMKLRRFPTFTHFTFSIQC